jgi:nicotinate-nucleotide adenylyltransferase
MDLRLGILGGTFDPIHFGHLLAAEESRVTLCLSQVWFVPAAVPPHKQGHPILPIEHRLEMVRLAIADNPAFAISMVDITRPGPHYTLDTVRLLAQEWHTDPDQTFFIMGVDSLANLLAWHHPGQLVSACRLAVVTRPDYRANLKELEAALPGLSDRVDWVNMPAMDISSSDLQRRARAGHSIRYQTPLAVARYIAEHQLYHHCT